ncbi:MAG: YceI family protein [Flavobacteriales bacterium]|jgi:polyisoprenoid-binding protein YceI|nr:YceI family protein [Flavobacteriales bacterium]
MRKVLFLAVLTTMVLSCGQNKKSDNATKKMDEAPAKVEKKVEEQAMPSKVLSSEFSWVGSKLTEDHTGTLKAIELSYEIQEGMFTKGEFVLDMNSIACTDIKDAKSNADLVGHLKNEDFFHAEKFPKAFFTFESVEKKENHYVAKGKLTIKGITIDEEIVFTKEGDEKAPEAIVGQLDFDRTKFGITYKSKNFFKSLGDKFIKDIIVIQGKFRISK